MPDGAGAPPPSTEGHTHPHVAPAGRATLTLYPLVRPSKVQMQGEGQQGEWQLGEGGSGSSSGPGSVGEQDGGPADSHSRPMSVRQRTALPAAACASEGGGGSPGDRQRGGLQTIGSASTTAGARLREGEQWAAEGALPNGPDGPPLSSAMEVFDALMASGLGVSRHSISVRE